VAVLKNSKHEAFAQGLAKGLSADAAYQAAGYKPNRGNASVLKANQSIEARIAEIMGKAAERVEVDKAWVLNNLKTVAERCMQAVPVLDRRGEPVLVETANGELSPAYTFQAMGANRALELIGKDLGMFVEKVEHTGKDGGPIETKDVSPMDAARLIAFTLAKAAKEISNAG
jgi:phage terminase small subunit